MPTCESCGVIQDASQFGSVVPGRLNRLCNTCHARWKENASPRPPRPAPCERYMVKLAAIQTKHLDRIATPEGKTPATGKRMFKTHNTLGKPLCPCCGSNPRAVGTVKCGRCVRESRPIQWDRLEDSAREEIRSLLESPPSPRQVVVDFSSL